MHSLKLVFLDDLHFKNLEVFWVVTVAQFLIIIWTKVFARFWMSFYDFAGEFVALSLPSRHPLRHVATWHVVVLLLEASLSPLLCSSNTQSRQCSLFSYASMNEIIVSDTIITIPIRIDKKVTARAISFGIDARESCKSLFIASPLILWIDYV